MAAQVLIENFLDTGGYLWSTSQVPVESEPTPELHRALDRIEIEAATVRRDIRERNGLDRETGSRLGRLARLKGLIERELDKRDRQIRRAAS